MSQAVSRAILYDAQDRVLLACRQEGKNSAGMWSLPGGKANPGETPEETVIREVQEEMGISFVPTPFTETVETTGSNDEKVIWRTHYFVGRAVGRLLVNQAEHTDAKFFEPQEMNQLNIAFGHRGIVMAFLANKAIFTDGMPGSE